MGSVSRWSALARRFVTRGGRDGFRVTLVGSGTAFRDTPRPPALECHVARPLGGSEAAARAGDPPPSPAAVAVVHRGPRLGARRRPDAPGRDSALQMAGSWHA